MTPLTLPTTLADAILLYIESKGNSLSSKSIRNLRTALKKSVLLGFGFSDKALENLDQCFAKLTVREFVVNWRLYFDAFYQDALAKGKNEDTLRNYRSCLNRLHLWMQSELWYQEVVQITEIPDRAPWMKSVASLQAAHRGRRKSGEYPYALQEAELTPRLVEQLESLKSFLTAAYMPARRGEAAIRQCSWYTRKEHIMYFLGWLHHDISKTFKYRSCPLHGSQKKLDELDITCMADRETIEDYIGWQLTVRGNGYKHAEAIGTTALAVAKWNFAVNEKVPRQKGFDTCEAVSNIRAVMNELNPEAKRDRRTTSRQAFDEKLMDLEQCQDIVEYLRQCCAPRTFAGHKRSNRRIVDSWQDYLLCAILTYTPIRQREIRELEIGKNLRREQDGWWVTLSPEQHKTGSKTGKEREYPLFPCHLKERLTRDLDKYIADWRSLENLDHNFLFFIRGTHARRGEGRGKPIESTHHLSRLIPKLIYRVTAILYGKQNAKATTPHDFRRIFNTWLFKYGTSEDIEIYTEILGHSPEEARSTYQQVTSREKTERAERSFQQITERAEARKTQRSGSKNGDLSIPATDLKKLVTVLTPSQKKQLGWL